MTENEKNAALGRDLRRRSAAKRELACLVCRAEQMAEDLARVSRCLRRRDAAEAVADVKDSSIEIKKSPRHNVIEWTVEWPAASDIGDLISEMDGLEAETQTIEKRLAAL